MPPLLPSCVARSQHSANSFGGSVHCPSSRRPRCNRSLARLLAFNSLESVGGALCPCHDEPGTCITRWRKEQKRLSRGSLAFSALSSFSAFRSPSLSPHPTIDLFQDALRMLGEQWCLCLPGLANGLAIWDGCTRLHALATLRLRGLRPAVLFFYHQHFLHGIDLFRCVPSGGARPGGARPVVAFFLSCSSSFKHFLQILSPRHLCTAQSGKVAYQSLKLKEGSQ